MHATRAVHAGALPVVLCTCRRLPQVPLPPMHDNDIMVKRRLLSYHHHLRDFIRRRLLALVTWRGEPDASECEAGGGMPDPGIPAPAPQTVASVKSWLEMNSLRGMASGVSTAIKVENFRLKDILTSHVDRLRELEADDPPLVPRPAFTFTEGGLSRIASAPVIPPRSPPTQHTVTDRRYTRTRAAYACRD
ncbi:hypothetical protein B0H13DRAFT_1911119 [Mycena leptocephala]|nr:hypothetical protein B0H13DRAFT_1911119 [Mycena leptocephala]